MKVRTLIVWWLVNGKEPKQLAAKERKIENLMPIVSALFPGINYYSASGFMEVIRTCVVPALKKQFWELLLKTEEEIASDAMTEIAVFLPSNGYEWTDSQNWKAKFNEYITA